MVGAKGKGLPAFSRLHLLRLPGEAEVMTENQWNEYKNKSRGWVIRMSFEVLHSDAYRELNYAPALKVLNWFYEKLKIKVIKGKRGKNHYQVIDGDISFPYREAIVRGLSSQQFSKALKQLHYFGFIEVKKPGSALKGDWTKFEFSERWKEFGTPTFKYLEVPQSVHWVNFGFKARPERCRKNLDMRIHT